MVEEQLSDQVMNGAQLSLDGRFVAFFDKGPGITFFPLNPNEKEYRIALPAGMEGKYLSWASVGDHIFAVLFDPTAKTNSVWRLAIDGSASVKIRDLAVKELGERSSFAVSADERYFAVGMGNWKHDAVLIHGLK